MVAVSTLETELRPGEALRYHTPLRHGGRVGLTDERLLVRTADSATSVSFGDIDEVTIEEFDWFLGVLSLLLVGFGLLSVPRNLLFAVIFTALGVGSLYWTYRKRGRVRLHTHGRPKPLSFSLDATEEFHARLGQALDNYVDDASRELPR